MSYALILNSCENVTGGNYTFIVEVTHTPSWLGRLFGRKKCRAKFESPEYPKYTFWRGLVTREVLHDAPFLLETRLSIFRAGHFNKLIKKKKESEWIEIEEDGLTQSNKGLLPKAIVVKK